MFKLFKSLLSEKENSVSMMRFLVAIIVIVFLFNWTYINIKTGILVPLDAGSVLTLLGAVSAKALQKNIEIK